MYGHFSNAIHHFPSPMYYITSLKSHQNILQKRYDHPHFVDGPLRFGEVKKLAQVHRVRELYLHSGLTKMPTLSSIPHCSPGEKGSVGRGDSMSESSEARKGVTHSQNR